MSAPGDRSLASLHEMLAILEQHAVARGDTLVHGLVGALVTAVDRLASTLARLHSQNDDLLGIREELQYQRQLYVDLFHNAPEPYVVTDISGVITNANAATSRLLGTDLEGLVGRRLEEFVSHEDVATCRKFFRTLDGTSATTELVVIPANHAPVVVAATVVPRSGGTRRPPELRWMLRDVTDARRAQAALQAAFVRSQEEADELRDLDRWKDAFLAAAAHDLHTPLSIITSTVRSLSYTFELGSAAPLVERIGDEAQRVTRLLDDLLDLDRFTRGAVTADRQPTDVARLIEEAVEHAPIDLAVLQVDAQEIVADLDPDRTGQIITNLIMNASTHTPPGTPVRLLVRHVDGGVEIVVEDEGPGVPSALHEEVFHPFVTRRAHDGDALGSGLGLSLVRLFAELHQGSARMEGRPGGGTRVVVHLPARVQA